MLLIFLYSNIENSTHSFTRIYKRNFHRKNITDFNRYGMRITHFEKIFLKFKKTQKKSYKFFYIISCIKRHEIMHTVSP